MLRLSVQDMTCNHCATAITKAVKAIDSQAEIAIKVVEKTMTVHSQLADDKIMAAVQEAGYAVVKIGTH